MQYEKAVTIHELMLLHVRRNGAFLCNTLLMGVIGEDFPHVIDRSRNDDLSRIDWIRNQITPQLFECLDQFMIPQNDGCGLTIEQRYAKILNSEGQDCGDDEEPDTYVFHFTNGHVLKLEISQTSWHKCRLELLRYITNNFNIYQCYPILLSVVLPD